MSRKWIIFISVSSAHSLHSYSKLDYNFVTYIERPDVLKSYRTGILTMSITHLSLILVQLLCVWTWGANAECCHAEPMTFRLNCDLKCISLESAYEKSGHCGRDACALTNYPPCCIDSKCRQCAANICGGANPPMPCCGVGACDIFCCKCKGGCWPGNPFDDFYKKHFDHLFYKNKKNYSVIRRLFIWGSRCS